jgi:DNA-binding HxlR family transcriptional regulator
VLLDLLANKWSALAIGLLERGPARFTVLQSRMEGVSPKMLTRTLRRLESAQLVTRTIYPEVPPRVEYALTDLGVSASIPLRLMCNWAEEHVDRIDALNREWAS